mmetsp:Transcript_9264/g.27168  ORF Transcript_9264/g.27168 Transcript_9264/m.27168 type:complete len:486 (-) Transcript_9264:1649-3106(-)
MATYWKLYQARPAVFAELDALLEDADANRAVENGAALKFQCLFRGWRVRVWHAGLKAAAETIERVSRGMLGRRKALREEDVKRRQQSLAVYHYFCALIQRSFRGFYSRRYRHDFHARKAYLKSVIATGETLRQKMDAALAEQQANELAEAEERRRTKFTKVASKLHHLCSTKAIPGIYGGAVDENGAPEMMAGAPNMYFTAFGAPVPTVGGIPVEQHLTAVVKDLIRTKKATQKVPLQRDINGTLRLAPVVPVSRRSIQASEPYEAHKQMEREERKTKKLLWKGRTVTDLSVGVDYAGEAINFKAGGRVKPKPYERGVNEGAKYVDPWRNPYMIRGIPQSQAELSMDRTSLGKAPAVPFYTHTGGNKSAVLPNDRFDVIGEAQQSGGVTLRHQGLALGNTVRFGVPDSCDVGVEINRNEDSGMTVRRLEDLSDSDEEEDDLMGRNRSAKSVYISGTVVPANTAIMLDGAEQVVPPTPPAVAADAC